MNFVQRIVSKALFKRIVLGGSTGREDSGDLHRASGDEHRELFLRACSSFRFLEHIPHSLLVSRTALLTPSRDSAFHRPQPCCFANIPRAFPTPEPLHSCSDYLECSFPVQPVPSD